MHAHGVAMPADILFFNNTKNILARPLAYICISRRPLTVPYVPPRYNKFF